MAAHNKTIREEDLPSLFNNQKKLVKMGDNCIDKWMIKLNTD